MKRPRFLPDNFTLAMIATVIAASFFPCHGQGEIIFNNVTHVAVSLLFFLHGAKLSREAVIAGITHWRLHLLVMLCTFALFPLLGLLLKPVLTPLVTPDLYLGILFLCMLPSTVQSSIAFTAAARGNVPAAICSASASNLFGIFLTPVLVGLLTSAQMAGGSPLDSALQIALQLLLPFIAGQIARRWIGGWVERNKALTRLVDQGSILLVVYTAFSEAVGQGLWHDVSWATLAGLMVVNALLLGLVMFISAQAARRLGFNREDRIAIVFCGSKKSLASGVPMAKVLFAGGALGAVVLPLMLFHQLQLMVCAVLAQRYAKEVD
ncbi:bile acid:sodium symporter [Duganella dendranthematis]|uniref:Bile acid:sodium symporter n=1 Tax=Duganella dendranthematis TaxID=2728021 RepID=A0ABX6MI27_9BURK|nr:bile acid:sodium symporter family protein [Duganella dendranthematis]QJD93970.1 bile acid:sodium symporter [Duganella dendranthematis]